MAGNVLGKGYTAGVGHVNRHHFGRIAGKKPRWLHVRRLVMRQLEKLIIDAQIITEPEAEVERVMQVCNACRYCEGFCAVFPAMTQRLEFGKADINYLANLCHNCGACLHACQYAPPHEFAINVPKAMAEVRLETYQHYAQPAAFGALYRRAGVTVTLALVFSLILFFTARHGVKGSLFHPPLAGDFYQIFPA